MTETSYYIVETDIPSASVHNKVLAAFCYGIFQGKHRTFVTSSSPTRLVFAFTAGEDATFFKLKELDNELLEIMDPTAAKRIANRKTRAKRPI